MMFRPFQNLLQQEQIPCARPVEPAVEGPATDDEADLIDISNYTEVKANDT